MSKVDAYKIALRVLELLSREEFGSLRDYRKEKTGKELDACYDILHREYHKIQEGTTWTK